MLWTNSVPEVPSEQTPWPSSISPAPIAAQALSPPPATTGVPAGRPVSAAAAVGQAAGDLGPLEHLRQQARRDVEGRQHLVAVAAAAQVEEQGARGVGGVGGVLAGQPQPDEVLGQQELGQPRRGLGLVRPQPQQLGRLEAGAGAVAGDRDHALAAQPRVDLVALGMGAGVVPQAAPGGSGRRRRRGTPSRASGPTGRCRRARARWQSRRGCAAPRAWPATTLPAPARSSPGRGVSKG